LAVATLSAAPRGALQANLILISIDTTRADALSCYGQVPGMLADRGAVTPVLDAIAAEGVRFERFWSHAPTTLNSHASMFTGLDPHGHGVPRNGFPLDPGLPTLAGRLGAVGYDAIAVVGAKALESPMGLDHGFRVYDDDTALSLGPMMQDRAAGVVDRTLRHLDARRASPLFLFVHFYDPHAPYDAPEPYRRRYGDPGYAGPIRADADQLGRLRNDLLNGWADPADIEEVAALYSGEVAYVDAQIGRLLEELERRSLLTHALVVVTSDHGEVLSELPDFAWSHGSDVSEGALHVPLLLRGYGWPVARRAVVGRQAAMSSLAPTLEVALGLEATLGDRASFWDLARPGPVLDEEGWPDRPVRPVLLEATRPRPQEDPARWNNLPFHRGVRAGGFAIAGAPFFGEPYAPTEGGPVAMVPVLQGIVGRWDAAAPPHRAEHLSAGTEEALSALGYLEPTEPRP
jgi:arylsulfatase A-like enzyme